jgi:hypothetical protein
MSVAGPAASSDRSLRCSSSLPGRGWWRDGFVSGLFDAAGWDSVIVWDQQELGSAPARRLFVTGHVSCVLGVALEDGREVVIKLRADDERVRPEAVRPSSPGYFSMMR